MDKILALFSVLVFGLTQSSVTVQASTSRNCSSYGVNGKACSNPYKYKNGVFTGCTTAGNEGKSWCSTTPDYDKDKQWSLCAGSTCDDCKVYSKGGIECALPFTYKGKTYNHCTNADNGNKLWCYHTPKFTAKAGRWGECGDTLCGKCTVHTERGKHCSFPFTYKGVEYHHCTRKNHKRAWCSLNGKANVKGTDWDNCVRNECSLEPYEEPYQECKGYACENGGTCVTRPACECAKNFYGQDCEIGLRLTRSTSELEGNLEIFHNSVWGSICAASVTDAVAEVACRTMGYRSGTVLGNAKIFGFAYIPVWLASPKCSGKEVDITKCTHHPWGVRGNDCRGEDEQLAVRCSH